MFGTKFGLPLVIAFLLLVLLLCVLIFMPRGEGRGQESETVTDRADHSVSTPKTPTVEFLADLSAFEADMAPSAVEVVSEGYLLLANKQNTLAASFEPVDLVPVVNAKKDISLRRAAERALEAMFAEMAASDISGVFVTSAYRSFAYQTSLFDYYIGLEMQKDVSLSREAAREKVLRYSAAPGTSEHQSGLAVDLMCEGMAELDESFAGYPVYDWLCENAWKFGFILRFPADKTSLTGYDYEPWHYRYVGRDAAYEIWREGICLEEYSVR